MCEGGAVNCGDNEFGQYDLPAPFADLSYTQGPAGARHTALIRSEGGTVGGGGNEFGQCGLPAPIADPSYVLGRRCAPLSPGQER